LENLDMAIYKTGAIHSARPAAILPLASLTSLPAPKIRTDWIGGIDLSLPGEEACLGNCGDTGWGNCVEVSALQIIRLRTEVVWGPRSWLPTTAQALALYTANTVPPFNPVTDGGGPGTDTNTFMSYWASTGIRVTDQTIDVVGWCHADLADTASAIDTVGPVRMTFNLPAAAEDPTNWAKAPGTGPDWEPGGTGMHSIVGGSQQNGNVSRVITWGMALDVHPDFVRNYWVSTDVPLSRLWLNVANWSPSDEQWAALEATLNFIGKDASV
jgi:hypothetical protein